MHLQTLRRAALVALSVIALAAPAFAAAAAAATTVSTPLAATLPHPCTGAPVVLEGWEHTTFQFQQDGSFRRTTSLAATGAEALTRVKYVASEETHEYVDDDGAFSTYHYFKFIRSGDVSTPLGGDDFFLRYRVTSSLDPNGLPQITIDDLALVPDGPCR